MLGNSLTTYKIMRLIGVCLLLLVFALPLTGVLEAASAHDTAQVDPPVLYYDYPGSLLGSALSNTFPFSAIKRQQKEKSLLQFDQPQSDYFMLLPEHKAEPLIHRFAETYDLEFMPLYQASLVIAVDQTRVGRDFQSWLALAQYLTSHAEMEVGVWLTPELLFAALGLCPDDVKAQVIRSLAALEQEDRLALFRGRDANRGWPLKLITGGLQAQDLPPILLLWDYQAAQINLQLAAEVYTFHPPEEGALALDFGLVSLGARARYLLLERDTPMYEPTTQTNLLHHGYRLPNGDTVTSVLTEAYASDAYFAYPDRAEYQRSLRRIGDYEAFNRDLVQGLPEFRRQVLNQPAVFPASSNEEMTMLSLLLPFFLIWIASIFFRLDEPATWRSMGLLIFWLAAAIFIHFTQLVYAAYSSSDILYYIRFLPYFGMVESWFFTGIHLARTRGLLEAQQVKFAYIISLSYYLFTIIYMLNDLHGYSFTLTPFLQIGKLGPFFYVQLIISLGLWLAGFLLLLKGHARVYRSTVSLPLMAFLGLLVANFYWLRYNASLQGGTFDLMNIVGSAVFLEICLQTRLIPANSGYIRLFDNSPIHLRLLSDNLKTIYPTHQDNISRNSLRLIRQSIEEKADWSVSDSDILRVPSYGNPGLIYNVGRVNGGYLIWDEDIREISRLKEELSELTQYFEHQGRMLAKERNFRSQYLSIHIRRNMLRELETSLSKQLVEISASLRAIKEAQDSQFVRRELSRVKIMVSQCKRKSNLLIRGEEAISMEEVQMIFREALEDAKTAGIEGAVMVRGEGLLPTQDLLIFYDYLQRLFVKSVDVDRPSFFITLSCRPTDAQLQILFHSRYHLEQAFFEPEHQEDERKRAQATCHIQQDGPDVRIRIAISRQEDKA